MWLAAIGVLLLSSSLTQVTLKSIVNKLPMAKSLALQFFFSALFVIFLNLALGKIKFEMPFLAVGILGFVNAFGAYCQWRAYRYSLSKSALLLPLSVVITLILTAILLNESKIYNAWMITGAVMLIASALILSFKKTTGDKHEDLGIKWLAFVLGMVLIGAIATFLMKYAASDASRDALPVLELFPQDAPRETFLLYWYVGAFLGALPILWLERANPARLIQKGIWRVPLASAGILIALGSTYWAFELAPSGKILTITNFGTTFMSLLFGWIIFKEMKGLDRKQIAGFLLGAIGVVLVILNT